MENQFESRGPTFADNSKTSYPLTDSLIQQFIDDGAVVVPVLSREEVEKVLESFAETLRKYGVAVDNLEGSADELASLSSTGGSGGILDVFYEEWKLKLNEDPRVVAVLQQLWSNTYCNEEYNQEVGDLFYHPYGKFNSSEGYSYIDRVCYRIPSALSDKLGSKKKGLQRSLTPHLDCCPHDMFPSTARKWRPIQAFIALTDNNEANTGGLEACLGFHREFHSWSKTRNWSFSEPSHPPPCVGEFTPIRPKEDEEVIDRVRHIPYKAGDLICWDFRIPHSNARRNNATICRSAVYIGLLPAIPLNRIYAEEQLSMYLEGIVPMDQWHSHNSRQLCSYNFSTLGKKLMTIKPW